MSNEYENSFTPPAFTAEGDAEIQEKLIGFEHIGYVVVNRTEYREGEFLVESKEIDGDVRFAWTGELHMAKVYNSIKKARKPIAHHEKKKFFEINMLYESENQYAIRSAV